MFIHQSIGGFRPYLAAGWGYPYYGGLGYGCYPFGCYGYPYYI